MPWKYSWLRTLLVSVLRDHKCKPHWLPEPGDVEVSLGRSSKNWDVWQGYELFSGWHQLLQSCGTRNASFPNLQIYPLGNSHRYWDTRYILSLPPWSCWCPNKGKAWNWHPSVSSPREFSSRFVNVCVKLNACKSEEWEKEMATYSNIPAWKIRGQWSLEDCCA